MSDAGVSVLLCSHNGAARLPGTLAHLRAQAGLADIPWEVVVVDNASSQIKVLAWKLTQIIEERKYTRYSGSFRSGKLNTPKLWKQRLGEQPSQTQLRELATAGRPQPTNSPTRTWRIRELSWSTAFPNCTA